MGPTAHWAEVTQACHGAETRLDKHADAQVQMCLAAPEHPSELLLPLHFCTLIKFDKLAANSSCWSVIIKYLKNKGEPLSLRSVSTAC